MNIRKSYEKNFRPWHFLCFIVLAGTYLCSAIYPDIAESGPYLNSAHANYTPGYGVNRSSLSASEYSKGNCAHCHEQHAMIGGSEPNPAGGPDKYELFGVLFEDQSSMFCFQCHTDNSPQQQTLNPQYDYSRIAGGDTNTCPNDIKEAFQFVNATGASQSNCGSSSGASHFLVDIMTLLTNKGSTWNFSSTNEDNNPCSGCHNPHRAQRDPHTSSQRGWPVSRPSQHSKDNNAWEIWGDNLPDATERMSNYATGYTYQAPCRYTWSDPCTSFEPDGSATTDGSNLADYVTFCRDCHSSTINRTNPITHYSLSNCATNPGFQTNTIPAINWDTSKHGKAEDLSGGFPIDEVIAPYTSTDPDTINYVLSCLDCHEPHGSPNRFLIRQEINGSQGANLQDQKDNEQWKTVCNKCHNKDYSSHWTSWCCDSCHRHNPAAGMPGL